MKKIIGFILMVAIIANIAPTTIFATDDDIDDNFSSVLSVLDKEITVNIIENEATVYAVYYDGETLAKVQSFDAKTGKQTFTADFLPDAVYIWDDNMEALSLPWRSERDAGSDIRVELDLALLDEYEYSYAEIVSHILSATNPFVYFYKTSDDAVSTKYILEKGYKLFVNGVQLSNVDSAAVKKYIIGNPIGKVELTDTYGSDEGYDIIDVEYYATTRVTSATVNKVFFTSVDGISSIDIDANVLEDKEIEVNAYMNGETIDLSEIKTNDILSIKYNTLAGNDSEFFDIYVSREVREGVFSGLDVEERIVTIGTEDYVFVNWAKAYNDGRGDFAKDKLSNEYKIYLDSFGRIYTWEVALSSIKYAIVDKYQIATASSTYDNDRVRLWFTDGTYKYVEFAATAKITTPASYDNSFTGVQNYINDNATKDKVMNRVVSYKISSSTGKITSLEFLAGAMVENKYDERNEKIGSTIISDDTKLVNVEEFISTGKIDDIEVSSKYALVDGVQYTIYRYGTPSMIDNSYPLVLIAKGEASYTEKTTFAVLTKPLGSGTAEDGTVLDKLTVLYEGEEQVLFIDEEAKYDADLVAGDVVVLKKNASGKVKEVVRIFNADDAGFWNYAALKANSLNAANFNKYTVMPVGDEPFTMIWNPTNNDLTTKLIYAPIITYKGRRYLAQVDSYGKTYIDMEATMDNFTTEGATLDLITTDDTNVYVYDYNAAKYEKFYVGSVGDVYGTNADYATLEGDYYTIDWYSDEARATTVNFAFAKIVDDIVTDIFVIIGEDY